MPTSTRTQNEDTVNFEPEQDQMFERKGFDRPGIRRELANVTAISLDDMEIERGDKEFIDPRTLDMDFGPTGMGEVGGSGIETVRIDGADWQTFRYVNGFEMLSEEGVTDVAMQRNAVLETFDFLADANFMKGVMDYGQDTQLRPGAFEWLKNAIPSERTLDATDYADGTEADYDADGVEENIIKYDAFDKISGDLLTRNDANWDVMVGRQSALANFNKISGADGGVGGESYWERLNAGNAQGGVNDMLLIPPELRLDTIPAGANMDEEPPSVDLTTELSDDEVILLPDTKVFADSWVRLSEMPNPDVFGPYDLRGGREAYDYAWRYSHKFDPENRYPEAKDAIRITNVSALFA